jgi:hypothetical protein
LKALVGRLRSIGVKPRFHCEFKPADIEDEMHFKQHQWDRDSTPLAPLLQFFVSGHSSLFSLLFIVGRGLEGEARVRLEKKTDAAEDTGLS